MGRLTVDAEDVAFLRIEAHPPCLRPLLQFVQVCLQFEMVLLAGDRSVEEAVVREQAYLGLHGRWQIVDVAQEQDGT